MNVTDEIKQKLAIVSVKIKSAEEKLRSAGACVTTSHGDLTWEKWCGKFRITMKGKPLIENPIEDRVKGYKQVDELVKAAFAKASALMGDITMEDIEDDEG